MPDWSYQTILRPLFFKFSAPRARDFALESIGRLARTPFGPLLIDWMGHMRAAKSLERHFDGNQFHPFPWKGEGPGERGGIRFGGPVGLGAGLDIHNVALPALSRFGFGFLEVGPVTMNPVAEDGETARIEDRQAIRYPDRPVNDGATAVAERLRKFRPAGAAQPIGVLLAHAPGTDAADAAQECIGTIRALNEYADFYLLDTRWGAVDWHTDEWRSFLAAIVDEASRPASSKPLLVSIASDLPLETADRLIDTALALQIRGVEVAGGIRGPDGGRLFGLPAQESALQMVRHLRARYGSPVSLALREGQALGEDFSDTPFPGGERGWGRGVDSRIWIIASGGIHAPSDAIRLMDAGADLVTIHSGLVYSGPGLPKRTNEAIAHSEIAATPNVESSACPAFRTLLSTSWFWIFLVGLGMLGSGVLLGIVALTRVVMPYDETFVGLTRTGITQVNPRLLLFMEHDRLTFAGTMVSIGILYSQLAYHGIRRGAHWAAVAVRVSYVVGFSSFFLFIGFRYVDPLHAFAALVLLTFFVVGSLRSDPYSAVTDGPDWDNDRPWRRSQWGQLLFVMIGIGLILAGTAISIIGITSVFVPQDLMFLRSESVAFCCVTPHLMPLIAHDRAGFGGALASDGFGVLLLSLWGFRRGAAWVWRTLFWAGLVGFAAGIGVHVLIGYLNAVHLAPAFLALLLYTIGLALSYEYLHQPDLRRFLEVPSL